MSDFAETWTLIRGRFDTAVMGLTAEQLNWRLHPEALTIGEMALHVAGVEVSFISQLQDLELSDDLVRLRMAATDGSVNSNPFPFTPEEITQEKVEWALQVARDMVTPLIQNLTPEIRNKQIKSALGPMVDGTGAFARLAYHPGYHQGQAYLVSSAPGFPSA